MMEKAERAKLAVLVESDPQAEMIIYLEDLKVIYANNIFTAFVIILNNII